MRKMRFKYLAERNMMPFYKAKISDVSGSIQIKIIDGFVPFYVLTSQSVEKIDSANCPDNIVIDTHMDKINKGSIALIVDAFLYIHLGNLLNSIRGILEKKFDSIREIDSTLLESEMKKLTLILSYADGYEMFTFADLFLPINMAFNMHESAQAEEKIIHKWLLEYDNYLSNFTEENGSIAFTTLPNNISIPEDIPDYSHVLVINDGGDYGAPGAHHISSLELIEVNKSLEDSAFRFKITNILELSVDGYGIYACLKTILTMYHILELERIGNAIRFTPADKKLELEHLRCYPALQNIKGD